MNIIQSDILKSKRSMLGIVLLLIPALTILYEVANFVLRFGALNQQALEKNTDLWHIFLYDKLFILSLAIPLGITMIASIIANTEHQNDSWKKILSLPLSKKKVYTSKFVLLFLCCFASGTLLFVGMLTFGLFFDLGSSVPLLSIMGDSYLPIVGAIPIMAIQLWLSILIKNQAFPISIGAISTMAGLFFALSPTTKWLPWAYPLNSSTIRLNYNTEQLMTNPDLEYVMLLAIFLGLFLIVLGSKHFSKTEIN